MAQSEAYTREWNAKQAIAALVIGIREEQIKVRAEIK